MSVQIIKKQEIDSLYKKAGVKQTNKKPSTTLNTGTLRNKLSSGFLGAKTVAGLRQK